MVDALDASSRVKRVELFVPSAQLRAFQLSIEKLQGMARKLGIEPWDVQLGPTQWRAIARNRHEQEEGRVAVITGQAPVLEGWRFLAKIEHDPGGNLVKRVGGGDELPQAWHSCAPNCDHCKTPRNRNTTFMLENVASGGVRQVGSTCVGDFLGRAQRDPEVFLGMYDFLDSLPGEHGLDSEREYEPSMNAAGCGVEPVVLMRAVLKLVQEDSGYISAAKAETQRVLSTADRLRAAFWSHKPTPVVPDAAHHKLAPEVVEWLKGQHANDSVWLRNIAALANRTCIRADDAGLFASGFVAWNRALQSQLRQERGDGDWIGAPGDKKTVAATLERKGGFDTTFGFKSILTFRDEEGNALVWRTQKPPQDLVVGSTYHLQGTIKGHSEYAGEKQTEMARIVVAESCLFAFEAMPKFSRWVALATPDVQDRSGHTPLLKAVWSDKVEHAQALLGGGADPNQLNQGEVPLLAYANSVEMAKALMQAGARPQDVQGEWLKGMEPKVRECLAESIQAMPACASLEDGAQAMPTPAQGPSPDAAYFGPIVMMDAQSVVQRIDRAGKEVVHRRSDFPAGIQVEQMAQVTYVGGQAHVEMETHSASLERQ